MRVLHAATAALLLLAPAAALYPVVTAGREPTGSSAPAAPPGPVATPSGANDIDACLIGAWRATAYDHALTMPNGEVIHLTGSGWVQTFRADGTTVAQYDGREPWTGMYQGKRLELSVTGSITSHYRTRDGVIHLTTASVDGTMALATDGAPPATLPLEAEDTQERYSCTATSLRMTTDKTSAQLTRTVSPTPRT